MKILKVIFHFEWGKSFQDKGNIPIQYTLVCEYGVKLKVTGVSRHYLDKECYFPMVDYAYQP